MNPLLIGSGAIKASVWVWQTLKRLPWLLKILKNWKDIEKVLNNTKGFYDSAKSNGGLPTCDASREFIGSIRVIFEKQLVDFPEVDEYHFAEILREIEGQFVCAIEQGERHKVKK